MLLEAHDVATAQFTPQVLACLPPATYEISASGGEDRLDLRDGDLVICSIDPPNCRDIDDALSCSIVSEKVWEVGIHIADVTNFCHPETPLDDEARAREGRRLIWWTGGSICFRHD